MKKLVSLLLVLVMMLSAFTIVPFTASAADTKTVYFQNNWMWTDVKVYYWGSSSTNSAGWPGDTPQLVGNDGTYDIYAATVPTDITGIIFNGFDGGINANNQTPDILDSADGDCYYMVWNNQNEVGKEDINNVLPINPTEAPTQAPTKAPVTDAPTKAPTQKPTEAPTQPVADGLFIKVGGELYEVEKGDVFTYRYYLSVDTQYKVSSLDINMFYDTEGLDVVPYTDSYGDVDLAKHFPLISGGVVHNFNIDGEIYYNYSSVAGTRLPDGSLIFEAQFKVTADQGIYEISEKIVTMADSDMNKLVYDEVVLQDVFTQKVELPDGPAPVQPTTVVPTNPVVTQPQETEKPRPTIPPGDDGLWVVADGVEYSVKQGDIVTYTYYLTVDSSLKISSLDINTFYDTEGLDFIPYTDDYGDADLVKHFPLINGGVVNNFNIDGEIYYNYSSVAGIRLTNDAIIFEGQFKVTADEGVYNIDSKLITLADSDMNKLIYDQEVIQPGTFSVKTELLGGEIPTEPTEKATEAPQPTVEPTEKGTEAPQPTTPVVEDGVFVEMDGEVYKVAKGDVITYQYMLCVPDGTKISSIDMNTFYDTKGLDFMPYTDDYGDVDAVKHFPRISGGCVYNFNIDGEIYYNYSNVAGIRIPTDTVMFEGQFKVTADEGTYKIYTDLVTLADSDMNKIVYDREVIVDKYTENEVFVGLSPYEPTEAPTKEPVTEPTVAPTQPDDEPDGLYIRVKDTYYEVMQGQEYTFTYYLQVEDKNIGSLDARVAYDTEGLDFILTKDEEGETDMAAMFPILKSPVFNYSIDGLLYFNYSSASGVKFPSEDSVLFTAKFKVTAEEGVYDINPYIYCLADEKIGIIVDEGEVLGEYYDMGVLEQDLLIGDVNRDGKINVFDVSEIQRHAAEFIVLDDEQMILADTNFDGKVNIFDASEIQRFLAGQISGFVKK